MRPPRDQALQIGVKRRQEATFEAPKMQRMCSAMHMGWNRWRRNPPRVRVPCPQVSVTREIAEASLVEEAANVDNACRSRSVRCGQVSTMFASSASTLTRVQQWVQRPCPPCSKSDADNELPKLACRIIIRGPVRAATPRHDDDGRVSPASH
jgi:hypothetical protein